MTWGRPGITDTEKRVIEEIRSISQAVRGAMGESSTAWPQFWRGFPGGACSDASLVLGAILDDAGHSGFQCAWGEIVKPDGHAPFPWVAAAR